MHARKTFASSLAHELNTFWPHIVLLLLVVTLFWTNYTPHTLLTGWDNLHPEFNFNANILDRSVFSVWQEYQGLGVRAGNAHAADLLRQFFLYFLSNIFTGNLLRYLYHFTALFVGAVGVYELVTRKLLKHWHGAGQAAGLAAALFAVLNPGTMQNFYVPYESFSHTFASLPWLILAILTVMDRPDRRSHTELAVINILATPMFYIPTVFVVYCMILAVLLIPRILRTHKMHTAVTAVGIIIAVNAFWLLPFAAFVVHGTAFVSEVKINRIFTQEAFLRNQKFGTIRDVPMLRGFLFDTTDMADTKTGKNDYMMKPWISYFANPFVYGGHIALFAAVLIGLAFGIGRRYPYAKTMTAFFILSYIALANDNPPTGGMFRLLQSSVPLFKQIFRFPYTKFIVPAVVSYAAGIAYFVYALAGNKARYRYAVGALALVLLTYLNWPSFTGHFLYDKMRQSVPAEYAKVFDFFRTQPLHGKIANLPQPTFWGWTAYDWGYRGSGFPWYGIGQPILDRAFDVWNLSNERYFADLTRAVYADQSPEAVERVFRKYQISYLWLDERVILPYKPSMLFYAETKRLLSQSAKFVKVFAYQKQSVYAFTDAPSSLPVFTTDAAVLTTSPFVLTDRNHPKLGVSGNDVVYTALTESGALYIPSGANRDQAIPGTVRQTGDALEILPLLPTVTNNDRVLSLKPQPILSMANVPADGLIQVNNTLQDNTSSRPVLLYPDNNLIAVYDRRPTRSTDLASLFSEPTENCSLKYQDRDTQFGSSAENGSLTLYGTKAHPCVYGKLSDLLQTPDISAARTGIMDITLEYSSPDNAVPYICLTRNGADGCFFENNGSDQPQSGADGRKQLRMTVPLNDYAIGDVWIKAELHADTVRESRLSLRPIHIDFFTTPAFLRRFAAAISTPVSRIPIEKGTVSLIFPIQTFFSTRILPQNLNSDKKNCFTLANGRYEKSVMREDSVGDFVRYSATEASSCDSLSFTDPLLANGAIALYVSRNVRGRPLKSCVKIDPPGYCLSEDFVPATPGAWSTSPVLLPPYNPRLETTNYLELDNYAVGQEVRTNDLARITFLTIPYTWVTGLAIESPYADNLNIDTETFRTVQVDFASPSFHSVTVPVRKKSTLLVLSQSFDNGWIALQKITQFPYITPAGRHTVVNNWANGWELDAGTRSKTIYIFFWPQLLEWFGFLLLPVPFIWAWKMRHTHVTR